MARLSEHHKKVDQYGFGKCSAPMWYGGCPDGFCDEEAYGERPHSCVFKNAYTGPEIREDGLYDGYVPGLACVGHGGPDTRVFMDGDSWCAVDKHFINLQESLAGFGETPEAARNEFKKARRG